VLAARQPQPAPDSALTVDDFYAERAERLHRTGERDAARSDLARVKRAVLGTGTHQAKIKKILAIVDPIPGDEPQPDDDVKPAPELAACEVAIEQIRRMCQRPRETAGTSQGAVVNGERLAGLILAVIKAAGLEGK
jgi:hypothetical protein